MVARCRVGFDFDHKVVFFGWKGGLVGEKRMTGLRYLLVIRSTSQKINERGSFVLVNTVFYAPSHLSSSDRHQATCLSTLTLLTVFNADYFDN